MSLISVKFVVNPMTNKLIKNKLLELEKEKEMHQGKQRLNHQILTSSANPTYFKNNTYFTFLLPHLYILFSGQGHEWQQLSVMKSVKVCVLPFLYPMPIRDISNTSEQALGPVEPPDILKILSEMASAAAVPGS